MTVSTRRMRRVMRWGGAWALLATPLAAHTDILLPNGGEVLVPGSMYTIEWTIVIAHNQNNWDLWYSTEGSGGPWIPIATDLPPGSATVGSVHSYDWTVPDAPSDNVFVRVRMDNTGTDYFGVSDDALFIGELAEATPRNGSGVNNLCFTSLTVPRLGTSWDAQVAHSQHPGATFTLILVYAAPATVPIPGVGELLVSGPLRFSSVVVSSGTADTHSTSVPNNISLVGVTASSQGIVLGGGVLELCNAIDLVVGF